MMLLMTAMPMVIRIMLGMAEGRSDYGYDTSHDGNDNMSLLRVTFPLAKKNPMVGEEIQTSEVSDIPRALHDHHYQSSGQNRV